MNTILYMYLVKLSVKFQLSLINLLLQFKYKNRFLMPENNYDAKDIQVLKGLEGVNSF